MTGRVLLINTQRFSDDRGWFAETWNSLRFSQLGTENRFVQDNQSFSRHVNTIRGLHFQAPPYAQAKLVRVVRGKIIDVAVDIRTGSPTYGHWVSAELSADIGNQLFVPVGFAHGFCTLEPDTEVLYKVTDFYDRASDGGIRWDDPDVAVQWHLSGPPCLSDKDRQLPFLSSFISPFTYDGDPMCLVEVE
ncbi:dTDP-4-dehydrorhamnose 3,5-epimerase [Geminicoccus harenae]|uniref:dTDP-4-dehydrorhamnose 3,5-epimerase n=1 Tax=Geminicoccus harenae TaxID=2498453 RepID=UPI00168A439A|nr:dTDP-4-dehydrorhamnose 3,5-epimerase [Geminicoccus harenae]